VVLELVLVMAWAKELHMMSIKDTQMLEKCSRKLHICLREYIADIGKLIFMILVLANFLVHDVTLCTVASFLNVLV
jgi:hypothetical protein